MEITCSQLRNAKDTLDYINGIKQEIERLLYSKARLLYCGIPLGEEEYTHTVQCINETIDDLFRQEMRQCRHTIETWQQQDAHREETEWHIAP